MITPTKKIGARGFTLVESLVAITIFLMVILGPISIAAKGMQSSYFANEQATAIFLAQEGLESIKRLRDDNALGVYTGGGADSWVWYADPSIANCKANSGCDLEINRNTGVISYARSCLTLTNCKLKKNRDANTANGSNLHVMYGYGPGAQWPDSPYTRVIKLVPKSVGPTVNAAVEVTVTVTWSSPVFGSGGKVVLQSWLYDQYARYEP